MKRNHAIQNLIDVPVREDFPSWFTDGKKLLRGKCYWCAKTLENKRRVTCSPKNGEYRSECEWQWIRANPASALNVTSIRKTVHRNSYFSCSICGVIAELIAPSGLRIPQYNFHVDHIKALVNGGADDFSNFQLLCEVCHKEKTKADMQIRKQNLSLSGEDK